MVDEAILNGIRRFWAAERVSSVYESILDAYVKRLERVTVIVGKSAADSSSSGQVVVTAADYKEWMEVLEARLKELEAAADGTGTLFPDTEHVNFSMRYIDP